MKTFSLALLVLCAGATFASAAVPAPEIDPGSAVTVVALVGSTVVMALHRSKRK
jgi:hypothetical protein